LPRAVLWEFQDTVERLQELERLGRVGRLFVQTRTSQGAEYVNLVMVQVGRTVEGRRVFTRQIYDKRRRCPQIARHPSCRFEFIFY
jgi:hypothetical protein